MQAAVIMAVPILCYTHDVLGVKHLLRQLGATPVVVVATVAVAVTVTVVVAVATGVAAVVVVVVVGVVAVVVVVVVVVAVVVVAGLWLVVWWSRETQQRYTSDAKPSDK